MNTNTAKETNMKTTYYAVTNNNGPLSLRLGEHDSAESATAAYEALGDSEDDAFDWQDSARADIEDDLALEGCEDMAASDFDAALRAAGAREVGDLGHGTYLWAVDEG